MGETINVPGATIIINGGDPLPGCPKSWDEANKWQETANAKKDEFEEPKWRFDCGFKLDFDGPLISINSRFYPPTEHYGPGWDGNVTFYRMGVQIYQKNFECETLEQLKKEVESYVRHWLSCIQFFVP